MENKLQKLIDIMFDMSLTIKDEQEFFKEKSYSEVTSWVADQLRKCGFDTTPVGASWGKLINGQA